MTTTDLLHDTIYISLNTTREPLPHQLHHHELRPLNLLAIHSIRTLKQHTLPPSRHIKTMATRAHNHTLIQTDPNRRLAAQHRIRNHMQNQTSRRRILTVGTTMHRLHLLQNDARCSQGCLMETNDSLTSVGQFQLFKLESSLENSSRMPWS